MTQILMPALSPTMEEGNLAKWLVKVGDKIEPGQVIAEIETDKATMEVEAVDEGVISALLIAEGAQGVKVNTPRTRPIQSFSNLDRKNDPWPQSCWIMNRRTRNPAAGTVRSNAAHHRPRACAAQASTQMAASGTAVTAISKRLRPVLGSRYGASLRLQAPGAVTSAVTVGPFIGAIERTLSRGCPWQPNKVAIRPSG